jgi:hypothetical protein
LIITPLVAGSPELNPLDFYLWGHMKNLLCQQKVETQDVSVAFWMLQTM